MSFNIKNNISLQNHTIIKGNCEDSLRQAIKNKLEYLNSKNEEIKENVTESLYLVR
jgi:hypothetical protein